MVEIKKMYQTNIKNITLDYCLKKLFKTFKKITTAIFTGEEVVHGVALNLLHCDPLLRIFLQKLPNQVP